MVMMHIRFEHTHYPHWGERSGYVQLVRYLDPQRYHTELHSTPDNDRVGKFANWLTPFKPWLAQWIQQRNHMPWYNLGDLSAELAALERCSAGHVDIMHFLDGEHSGQFLPRLIKTSRPAVRTAATFHQPPDWMRRVANGSLLRWFDAIILVSASQLPFFEQFVPEQRLHVLPHGIDTEFFRPAKKREDSPNVRCITTGHWLRNWEVFKAVAGSVSDIAFDVVTRQNNNFDGLPNVTVRSGIGDAELAELYRSADILFLPLRQSTANNTLLEGVASGLPVIATDLESIRAYLPNGEAILVSNNSIRRIHRCFAAPTEECRNLA